MLLARAVSLSKVDSGSVPKIEREEFSWIGWFKKGNLSMAGVVILVFMRKSS